MKVLQINSVCGVGSTGRIATDIHTVLEERGYESWIGYGRGVAKNCENSIKIGNNLDNYVHVAKTRILDHHGFGSKKATEIFINKIKEMNPDVIHLHNIHGYFINIKILFDFLKTTNKKVIWTLHDCWAFTGHCSYFDYVKCDKWETGCYKCPQKKNYPSSFLFDNSQQNYYDKKEIFTGVKNMTIVTPSNWLAKLVKKSFLNEYPIEVINNGIDLEVFKPIESDFKIKYKLENKFIILGVASIWERRKGLDYFLELSKKIKEDEIIILVGLTEKQIKSLPFNIIGINKTNNTKELVELYSVSNIFLNPTSEDNFPTTNIEALACGIPVITFNTGGSPESIDESCGTVIPQGDLEELINTIKIYRKNTNVKNNCLERSKLYNKDLKYREYLKLYKN